MFFLYVDTGRHHSSYNAIINPFLSGQQSKLVNGTPEHYRFVMRLNPFLSGQQSKQRLPFEAIESAFRLNPFLSGQQSKRYGLAELQSVAARS